MSAGGGRPLPPSTLELDLELELDRELDLDPDPDPAPGFGGAAGFSRTVSIGDLSARRPWKLGWRSLPSLVHSLNRTWATSRGFTQCASRSRGAPRTSGRSTSSFRSSRKSSARCLEEKPVPTLPANDSSRPSLTA